MQPCRRRKVGTKSNLNVTCAGSRAIGAFSPGLLSAPSAWNWTALSCKVLSLYQIDRTVFLLKWISVFKISGPVYSHYPGFHHQTVMQFNLPYAKRPRLCALYSFTYYPRLDLLPMIVNSPSSEQSNKDIRARKFAGTSGIDSITRACQAFQPLKPEINQTTAMHVHVSGCWFRFAV